MNQENLTPPSPSESSSSETQKAEALFNTELNSAASAAIPPQAAATPVVEEEIDIDHFAKVKLRVALVESVEAVPKSKKLLKLQVNLGEQLGCRQILSGISQFYTPESLIGKRVIIVSNLKPAKLMGLESHGMLLAGSNDDSSVLAIIEPSEHLPLGSIVR